MYISRGTTLDPGCNQNVSEVTYHPQCHFRLDDAVHPMPEMAFWVRDARFGAPCAPTIHQAGYACPRKENWRGGLSAPLLQLSYARAIHPYENKTRYLR